MRWAGWVLFVVLGIVAVAVHQAGQNEVANVSKQHARQVAERETQIQELINGTKSNLTTLEKRLADAKAKTDSYRSEKEAAAARQAETNTKLTGITGAIDQLETAKADASDKHDETRVRLTELQSKVARLEKEIKMLQDAIPTVTDRDEK